ncbi:PfkB family carbohydrate kinase [Aeromonas molluscorum]|uniref:Carbohydrate kinase n=1 Tax=Aeromonas molluscorum 848 TaxID=1268236 RepID=R1FAE5_9GAMM|nr:PfkB family carbohydrate kinase [Aeromonas molluscorum]EOD56708.1 carbohydrate kinase [Aeromonas molluscorum 848]
MTEREQEILALLRQDPMIAQQELATRLGISRSALASHVSSLIRQGLVMGRGYVLREGPYAVVVGGANMDICGQSRAALRMGDSNPGSVRTSAGGVGRNIAENLARLGTDTRLVTAVGNDQHGHQLLEASQSAGVDVRQVQVLDGKATSCYLSLHDGLGEMSCAINDMGIIEELTPARLTPLGGFLSAANVLVLDTNLATCTLDWLFDRHGEQVLFVDTVSVAKVEKIRPWLGRIHTLKPNRSEAEQLCGFAIEGPDTWPRAAHWFHSAGVQRLFLSLGEQGIFYSDGETQGHLPILGCPVNNVTGGGDAFMAGLVHGWLAGSDMAQTTRFALGCAALTVGCHETVFSGLSKAAVERILEEYPC